MRLLLISTPHGRTRQLKCSCPFRRVDACTSSDAMGLSGFLNKSLELYGRSHGSPTFHCASAADDACLAAVAIKATAWRAA